MTESTRTSLRFPSIAYAPARTRASLRNRIERFLATIRAQIVRPSSEISLSDEAFLRLLSTVHIKYSGTVDNARTSYEAAADSNGPFPRLDDLIDAGWIRTGRGRVFISVDCARAAKRGLGVNIAAYTTVQQCQYHTAYSFDPATDSELDEARRSLEAKEVALRNISSPRPDWVVVRLWEELIARFNDDQKALEAWLDLRHEIGNPHVVPTDFWERPIAERFHEAAISLLECEPLAGWNEIRERLAREVANTSDVELEASRSHFLPTPDTTLGRYLWLTSNRHVHAFHAAMRPLEELEGLITILMSDVERNDLAQPPHPLFDRVMSILERRPELMFFFILYLENHPVLLADMLFRPTTSAWACLLIWKWQLHRDAWAAQAHRQDDDRNKATMFADAAAVLQYFLNQDAIPSAEVAELLTEMFRCERATVDTSIENSNAMRQQLLDELARTKAEVIQEVLRSLFGSFEVTGPGSGAFDAALALVEARDLVGAVDPGPLVQTYIAAMARDEFNLSAHQISAVQARALYELAVRAGTESEQEFLNPLKVPERLSERLEPDANPFTIADAISRTIRVHTRILSRVIVAHAEEIPDRLVNALAKTIETGSLNRGERNNVDAFSAGYETDFPAKAKDRSISADLGNALTKLRGAQRDKVLDAVLQIEEPLALVRLLFFTPANLRSSIENRIRQLTPDKASDLYMYTAAQMRIDQLLDADLPDVAAAFLGSEVKATASRKIPGRAIHRMRQQLRLHLLRLEWKLIEDFQVPDDVLDAEKQSAQETIEFFRGLASLKMPGGNPAEAETRFANLRRTHPEVPAYTVNLHAARVALLLEQNIFGYIDQEELPDALRVIEEGKDAISGILDLSQDDEAILRLNNAALLLATRQPTKALDVIDDIPGEARPQDAAFAYKAVGLARSGNPLLASAVLDSGLSQFGNTDALEAARKNIQSAAPYAGRVSTTSNQDVVSTIKKALHDLALLDPGEQARVFTAGDGHIGDFLFTQVREAAAATVDLAPMMRGLNADSLEDDITAIFKEILHARLRHVSWSVQDQGKGGFTAAGNPGERDLTIRKDAAILSVGEAVMTRHKTSNRFTRQELQSHLEKLFAYATCPVYFHITYEMSGDEAGVIEHLRKTSQGILIDGVTFIKHEEIGLIDSGPRGFSAIYKTGAGTQTVHFLVLDFHQGRQQAAAKASAASNPRSAKDKSSDSGAP